MEYSNLQVVTTGLTAMGMDMPYGITQFYLPPGRSDFSTFTPVMLVLDLATLEVCKTELT